jgi:serine/threonine-protein kinase
VYLAHEYVQGHNLTTLIGGRPFNPRRAIDVASQTAEALADAHASGLIHGALTTDAIVVTPKGHVKIIDFGLAAFDERAAARNTAARSPQAGRSPDRADLVALGVILFEMLTGAAPSPGAAVPSSVNRSLPREFDSIVTRALGIGGGYEAAATLAAELRALAAALDARQETDEAATKAKPAATSTRRHVGWVAVALVLAAAAWWYFSA